MSLSDEILDIETPENVAFGYQVAGLGSRFLATMIDTLLIGVLQFAVLLVMFLILRTVDSVGSSDQITGWVIAIVGIDDSHNRHHPGPAARCDIPWHAHVLPIDLDNP